MSKQKGQVIILTLLLMAAGSLMIVPLLRLMDTGLRSQRISERVVSQQYTTDSSMEDALWQMQNGVMDTLSAATPSYSYDISLGNNTSGVNISIPSIPSSEWQTFNQISVKTEVIPNWIKAQPGAEPVYRYVIRVDMPQWRLTDLGLTLPKGLDYVDNSTYATGPKQATGPSGLNPDTSINDSFLPPRVQLNNGSWVNMNPLTNPTVTPLPDGSKSLSWTLTFGTISGRKTYIQTFQARGYLGWGIYYVLPWFQSKTDTTINWTIYSDPTAALGSAMYYVIITSGGVTYRVVIAYDSTTGEMVIVSYDIVG